MRSLAGFQPSSAVVQPLETKVPAAWEVHSVDPRLASQLEDNSSGIQITQT